MLIEGVGQFLASSLQLLPQGEAVKHNSILKQKRENRIRKLFLLSEINILKRIKTKQKNHLILYMYYKHIWNDQFSK